MSEDGKLESSVASDVFVSYAGVYRSVSQIHVLLVRSARGAAAVSPSRIAE
jgi:hypothetical protein